MSSRFVTYSYAYIKTLQTCMLECWNVGFQVTMYCNGNRRLFVPQLDKFMGLRSFLIFCCPYFISKWAGIAQSV